MRLRTANHKDVPTLVELINAAYRVEVFFIRGDRTSEDEVRALMTAGDGRFFVYTGGKPARPVASVYASASGTRGHFCLLAVHPDHRGKGLARGLIAAAEQYCSAAGCNVVEIEVFNVRRELLPFYASCGYGAIGTTEYSNPEILTTPAHLILMSKRLAPAPFQVKAETATLRA